MSAETTQWLNEYTLQSVRAWHTDDAIQRALDMPTVYNGPIPVNDVLTRLFGWEPIATPMVARHISTEHGVVEIEDAGRKCIVRLPGSLGAWDKGAILGAFKDGYQIHGYSKWLVENVSAILDENLSIYSAGLLRGGAQAFVQVTVPDTITTPSGITFRPNLLAVTSLDGSLATTYKRTITNSVCDNTMGMALRESKDAGEYKVKHSRYSDVKLMEARSALQMVLTTADDFEREAEELVNVKVSDGDWAKFLDSLVPTTDAQGKEKTGRGLTVAENKRAAISRLWNNDNRVTPWKGTAYGVVQCVNTFAHHEQNVRGAERAERNMQATVTGAFDKLHAETRDAILAIVN